MKLLERLWSLLVWLFRLPHRLIWRLYENNGVDPRLTACIFVVLWFVGIALYIDSIENPAERTIPALIAFALFAVFMLGMLGTTDKERKFWKNRKNRLGE